MKIARRRQGTLTATFTMNSYVLLFMGGQMPADADELHANYDMSNFCSLYNQCIAIAAAYGLRVNSVNQSIVPIPYSWSARGGRKNNQIDTTNQKTYRMPDSVRLLDPVTEEEMAVTEWQYIGMIAHRLLGLSSYYGTSFHAQAYHGSLATDVLAPYTELCWDTPIDVGDVFFLRRGYWTTASNAVASAYTYANVRHIDANDNLVTDINGTRYGAVDYSLTLDTQIKAIREKRWYTAAVNYQHDTLLVESTPEEIPLEKPTWCIAIPLCVYRENLFRGTYNADGTSKANKLVPALVMSVSGISGSGEMRISDYDNLTNYSCAQFNSVVVDFGDLG